MEQSLWLTLIARAAVAVAVAAALLIVPTARGETLRQPAVQAPAPDASDVAEGMRLYQQKANCQACHGWAADGRKADNQMPDAPTLRDTKLGRAGLVMTITCGRLNTSMPAFDKFAYTDGRCYGKTQADLKAYPTRMPDPPSTLQPREIELIADFLMAKVAGKGPMDHAKCVDYWGADVEACREFPK